ncbi:pyrophosphatase PpaX [Vagococcus elongatus]|uniref:Pyrophosphatase PpaX n=2 Tax=Vagococcus elongatus TaxID=180344 RepID=A0A430AXC8_9ENTE|nr:pyrophosphatase PpaX [Vagococcus elongatus]
MASVQTVLFDFDGTLADTNHLIAQSYLHVFEKYLPGRFQTEESVRHFNGPSLEEVFSELLPEKTDEMVATYREFNHEKHDDLIQEFPCVEEVLGKLKKSDIRLAVVSTKNSFILKRGLEVLNIQNYFDLILGGTDYQKVKPDPEALHLAMTKLSSSPAETIMVGDNPQDIEAANRAKVRGIFVEWSHKTLAEVKPYKPYQTVKSMVELQEWITLQNNGGRE